MKKVLLFLLFFAGIQIGVTHAQCEPDPQYVDAPAGVYPLPDTVGSPTSSLPMGFENQPYELLFTAVVPDSIMLELNPGQPPLDADLSEVIIDEVMGLPPGLDYVCNPPDCVFLDQSQGCVLVSGTPTQAGTYFLTVKSRVGVGVALLPVDFPGALVGGEYKIIIDEDIAVDDPIENVIGLGQNIPNPFSDATEIQIDTKQSGLFEFKVYNVIGKLLHERDVMLSAGNNTITFNGNKLPSGMYFYSVGQGNDRVTRRMVVHRP